MLEERLDIVYQDETLIAVHKPSGLLTHRSELDRHETRFALQIVRDQVGQRVWATHRLDKGTSGILLFALNPETARRVGQAFENGEVDKTYLAIVRGHPPESGVIDHALSRRHDDYERFAVEQPQPAQPAFTRYRRLAKAELPYAADRYPTSRYALIEMEPLTGRRHQLRRHMKHIAHPIIGDATFGKGRHNRFFTEHFGSNRLLLACVRLRLAHPESGQVLEMTTPPAGDFASVAAQIGWNIPAFS